MAASSSISSVIIASSRSSWAPVQIHIHKPTAVLILLPSKTKTRVPHIYMTGGGCSFPGGNWRGWQPAQRKVSGPSKGGQVDDFLFLLCTFCLKQSSLPPPLLSQRNCYFCQLSLQTLINSLQGMARSHRSQCPIRQKGTQVVPPLPCMHQGGVAICPLSRPAQESWGL